MHKTIADTYARPGGTAIIITGATGSGKTSLAIELARHLHCHIISADSRQIYRDIPITTAAPTPDQLAAIPHHLVGTLPIDATYSAAQFVQDVHTLLPRLWQNSPYVIICGGSMMYLHALLHGIDDMPTITEDTRTYVLDLYHRHGLQHLLELLATLDPQYRATVDPANTRRIIHAIEVSLQAGRPYSSHLTGRPTAPELHAVTFALTMPRPQLFDRINARVLQMVADGMEQEAQRMYPLRHLNALNTVGFKEWFSHFDGTLDRTTAIARIAKNTRVYAKKQLTWLAHAAFDVTPLDAQSPISPLTQILHHLPDTSIPTAT